MITQQFASANLLTAWYSLYQTLALTLDNEILRSNIDRQVVMSENRNFRALIDKIILNRTCTPMVTYLVSENVYCRSIALFVRLSAFQGLLGSLLGDGVVSWLNTVSARFTRCDAAFKLLLQKSYTAPVGTSQEHHYKHIRRQQWFLTTTASCHYTKSVQDQCRRLLPVLYVASVVSL